MRHLLTSILLTFALLGAACSPTEGELTPPEKNGEAIVAQSLDETLPPTDAPTPTSPRLHAEPPQIGEPGIPQIVGQLDFGLPAGNGHRPRRAAIGGQRIYLFNEGLPLVDGGNTISVFDITAGQFTNLIRLNNHASPGNIPPTPLALTIDPYRPRLYAVWGDQFGEFGDTSLTIIDTETLRIVETIPAVEAIAPGPDRLYLANDIRLWAVDPDTLRHLRQGAALSEVTARDLEQIQYNGPIRLNVEANRLYLGRGRPWRVETFAADTLDLINRYPLDGDLKEIVIDRDGARLLVFERLNGQIIRRTLDFDGVPDPDTEATQVPVDVYGDLPVVSLNQSFYTFDLPYPDRLLTAFDRADFSPRESIALPCSPNDLIADPESSLIYAICSSPASVLLEIEPAVGKTQTHYTALSIVDALYDPDQNRLYVINNQGALRTLNLNDDSEIARIQTEYNALTAGQMTGGGELSLDPGRNRLYIGGNPPHIINTTTLEIADRLDTPGQLTPDPATDRLYLTPPCHCRAEQCNTLILSADTLTGTQAIFPPADPFTAPCVVATRLDAPNQLLYAHIDNGVPGSNSGRYYTVFDVSGRPQELYTTGNISFGDVAIDSRNKRAFAPRYRINRGSIHRFEAESGQVAEILELVAAEGQLAYDPAFDRLYAVQQIDQDIQVFDGDLTLLADVSLPGDFNLLDFDPVNQRLYLNGRNGELLVVATGGGDLQEPPPHQPTSDQAETQQLIAAPDGTIFRVFDGRLYRSADDGQSWDLLGHGLPGRQVSALALSPDYQRDQTLLAGLWSYGWAGGLYRSADGGDAWQPTTRGLTDLEVGQIAYSPTFARDKTIFVTTFDRDLFRSDDGGDSWQSLAPAYAPDDTNVKVDRVAVSPNFADDGLVFISRRNLWRSGDGGDTWSDVGLPGGLIAFSPNFVQDRLILLGGRWRTTDAGLSWQPAAVGREATLLGASDILFSPNFAADQTVYLTFKANYDAPLSIQRSTDAGLSWQSLLGGLPSNFALDAVAVLPNGDLYLTARACLECNRKDGRTLQSAPDALTWGNPPVDIVALDLQALAVAPDGSLFVANGGAGVLKLVLSAAEVSSDGGRAWRDAGFPARSGTLHSAYLAMGADGVLSAPLKTSLFAAVGSALQRSDDGGVSWIHLSSLPSGFEISALAISPSTPDGDSSVSPSPSEGEGGGGGGILLVGGSYVQNDILRSDDSGQSWQSVFNVGQIANLPTINGSGQVSDSSYDAAFSDVSAFAFSPNFAADQTVYAWLQYGGLLRSTDGALNWERVPSEQYQGYFVQSMAVSPTDGRVFMGALDGHLLVWPVRRLRQDRPGDGGEWLDLRDNIPDDRAWSSVLAFASDGALYLGTDKGVYRSDDSGQSWARASEGLPHRPDEPVYQAVRDLQFSVEGGLYAAMAKGGVFVTDDQGQSWRSVLSDQTLPPSPTPQPPPTAAPTAAPTAPAPTPEPTFTSAISPDDCPAPPAYFSDLWLERFASLDCPAPDIGGEGILMAEQSFERGQMFWRSDNSAIYVLPQNDSPAAFSDTWDDSQPAYTCPDIAPSQTPPTPQRGFGKVWCQEPKLREKLGNALAIERLFDASIQEFDSGLIFADDGGAVYILDDGLGEWERAE